MDTKDHLPYCIVAEGRREWFAPAKAYNRRLYITAFSADGKKISEISIIDSYIDRMPFINKALKYLFKEVEQKEARISKMEVSYPEELVENIVFEKVDEADPRIQSYLSFLKN